MSSTGQDDPIDGMRHWAREFLDGELTAREFAPSVWYLGTETGRPDDWIRFAHWGDDLDDLFLGRPRAGVSQEAIEDNLRAEATALLAKR